MKVLLRSVFIADPSDDSELFLRNYLALMDSGLGFQQVPDEVIWTYIKDFVRAHHHVPDHGTIRSHFERMGESEVADRLEHLAIARPKVRGNFLRHLEEKAEDRRTRAVLDIIKETATITQTGLTVKEGRNERVLRGPRDAVHYFQSRAHDIVTPTTGVRLSGDVTADGEDMKAEYERVEADPLSGLGQMTGLQQMDEALRGAKRQELWTHAAFTGGLKSTFMLNWAYNQAIWFRHSSFILSLEMPYQQCRRILYAIHSGHPKFKDIHPPLEYTAIRDGKLTPKEKAFYFEYVIPDMNRIFVAPDPLFGDAAVEHGHIHIEVADPTKTDFTVADLVSKAEMQYSKEPFSLLFVDHAGLMAPRKWVSSTTERLNEVLRDLKRTAMNFNRGMGMAVVTLFQISREGFKAAEKVRKAGGAHPYNLTHLSYANEAERSSDIVTASYVDPELIASNEVLFQNLKTRDDAMFETFTARVVWPRRRLESKEGVSTEESSAAGDEIDLEALEGI